MAEGGLKGFFETFIKKESIFANKKALQSGYLPEEIVHRDKQLNTIANILAPALKIEKPSNLFIYGKTGTGKTLIIKYVARQIREVTADKDIPLHITYLNCKLKRVADTEYRLIAQLTREFGKEIPPTGLPTDEVYKIFCNAIDSRRQIVIVVLDEIDQLVKKAGDDILYNLTRINDELTQAQITLVGISNDLVFADSLDPRVKSSLSEEEIIFPPYNALQIQNILKRRSRMAFKAEVIGPGVIEKCAAYAAREHGDARRALELLRVAGEIAEREGTRAVTIEHLDKSEEKIEKDRLIEAVIGQPKQVQATLFSMLSMNLKKGQSIFTSEVYGSYRDICTQVGLRPLTQRRIGDIVAELDMLGIINSRVISKGRYGRTREISLSIPEAMRPKLRQLVKDDLGL
ncbi:MAG: ORC1-type DNA replication protein [archaeon]